MIKVYTKNHCMQCEYTKKKLIDLGLPFIEINLEEQEGALDEVKAMGFQSMPVVVPGDGEEPFFGFRPDKLGKIIEAKQTEDEEERS